MLCCLDTSGRLEVVEAADGGCRHTEATLGVVGTDRSLLIASPSFVPNAVCCRSRADDENDVEVGTVSAELVLRRMDGSLGDTAATEPSWSGFKAADRDTSKVGVADCSTMLGMMVWAVVFMVLIAVGGVGGLDDDDKDELAFVRSLSCRSSRLGRELLMVLLVASSELVSVSAALGPTATAARLLLLVPSISAAETSIGPDSFDPNVDLRFARTGEENEMVVVFAAVEEEDVAAAVALNF